MNTTPEGKVKAVVKQFLMDRRVASLSRPVSDAVGYYHMYVPSGYGDPALDFTGCYKGRFFAIETKARPPRGRAGPSAMQNRVISLQRDALGFSIWGDDAEDICKRLGEFFDHVDTQA